MKKYMYGMGLVLLLILTSFILPIWQVQTIDILGIAYYTEEDIKNSISFEEGTHILRLNRGTLIEQLNELNYIENVSIERVFPNRVIINIKERSPIGYVKFLDSYLCIDETGYVIEQSTEKRLEIPEIEGLTIEQFSVKQTLEIKNVAQLAVVGEMIKVLNKYDFLKEVESIDVSNIQQIHLYVDRLNVIIGSIRDFDKKIKYLIEVHKKYAMGILDLTLIDQNQAILKPIN